MADVQIRAAGPSAAPLDYVVPGAHEIDITMLSAHFDGTSASVAWLPAIEILSDGGTSCGIITQDNPVAAGASVEAAWAPFLRSATGGAAPTGNWKFGYSGPVVIFKACPAGTGTLLSGDPTSFYTSSSADFAQGSYVTGGSTYYGTKILTPGHYLGLAYVAVLKSGGGAPLVGAHYNVQPALNDGDLEESFFLFGDTNYMAVSNSDYPISTLYGDLGTVSTPATEFRNPWIFTFDNNGASDLEAYVGTLLIKLDSDTTSLA